MKFFIHIRAHWKLRRVQNNKMGLSKNATNKRTFAFVFGFFFFCYTVFLSIMRFYFTITGVS